MLKLVREGEMPQRAKPLKPEEIATLEHWIKQGAKTIAPGTGDCAEGVDHRGGARILGVSADEDARGSAGEVRRACADAHRCLSPREAGSKGPRVHPGRGQAHPLAPRDARSHRSAADARGARSCSSPTRRPTPTSAWSTAMLASPHYGERWGRHWLDVAGYADSDGYTDTDPVRLWSFKYRDYVIRAFNADKPFDQFIREQLAGDEMVKQPYKDLSTEDDRQTHRHRLPPHGARMARPARPLPTKDRRPQCRRGRDASRSFPRRSSA